MDDSGKDYTSSTSVEPNSPFQGNDVKKLIEEIEFKLKNTHNRRLAIKHFMSTSSASKASIPKRKKMAERNKTQTLDLEGHDHSLPRSFSFDSSSQPYDPIKNHFCPRPRYLKYNPDRHREIFARQKNVNRFKRSASYDAGMLFPEEELESSEHEHEHEHGHEDEKEHEHDHEKEEENEEQFDDFEENTGWNSKVFLQYLLVMIVLILTTLTITSINSPTLSPARERLMNLYHKAHSSVCRSVGFNFSEVGIFGKREIDVNHDEIWTKDVGDGNMDSNQLEGSKTAEIEEVHNSKIDEDHAEIWSKNDTGQFQDSQNNEIENEENSYELHEPVVLLSAEIYRYVDRGEMVVEEDVGKEDDENILIKMAKIDSSFAAFIGVCVLILATLSVIYCLKKWKISSIAHQNSTNNTKNLESFVNSSPLTYKTTHSGSLIDSDAVSSGEAKSSYLEFSNDSPSYGSFTVEKKIVKKKKSKTPEVMVSPVRRSSRIHKRSVISP